MRENSEGEYSGVGGRVHQGHPIEVATDVSMMTRAGVERIMRFAFRLAQSRPRKLLTVVTKSNAQRHAMVMWDEIAVQVAREFPDVKWDKELVDACTARMVNRPASLDTLVATNLHADILSDLAAALAGSLGIAPTGNIDPERRYPSMFEPIHGSAFDIMGKGLANPIGTFWSCVMLLEHLGESGGGAAIDAGDRSRHRRSPAAHARPGRQGHHRGSHQCGVRAARAEFAEARRLKAPIRDQQREGSNMKISISTWLGIACLAVAPAVMAQTVACPEKNVLYWQAFPPGGESDLSARHQQMVLHKKCPGVETIIQYKAGAGGGLMWSQMNQLPGDGLNVVGVNLPHIVFQPIQGDVQYKTADVTPVFWFHFTPDILVVSAKSPIKNFQDFLKAAKADPGKISLAGSGQYSANHAAHERLDAAFGIKTLYVPFKGTGDLATSVLGGQVDGAMTYTPFAIANKDKGVRPIAVAMEKRHPLMPDVPTFKELGVDWVDGAYRGIGVPKSTSPEARKRLSDMWRALNNDPEMKELAAKIRVRTGERGRGGDGRLHEGQDQALHRRCGAHGPGQEVARAGWPLTLFKSYAQPHARLSNSSSASVIVWPCSARDPALAPRSVSATETVSSGCSTKSVFWTRNTGFMRDPTVGVSPGRALRRTSGTTTRRR